MTEPRTATRIWPSSPYDLADAHRCPSCFTVVSAATCPSCGFALTDARAPQVLELGRRLLDTEIARQRLIDEIRASHAAVQVDAATPGSASVSAIRVVAADATVPAPAAPRPIPTEADVAVPTLTDAEPDPLVALSALSAEAESGTPELPLPSTVAPAAATVSQTVPARPGPEAPGRPPAAPAPVASTPRRRLTVPVLLLIVGVSLVGIAAVFFLLLAWFVAGIAVKALIIGAITLATIVVASWLPRRDLTATAEGVGALGVVLLALDAWAVRANDLFGAGGTDPAVYTGVAALVVAALCRVWARVSGLRGPDLATSLAVPAGAGFLVGGLAALPSAEALVAGFLGAGVGGLVHALPAPWSSARGGAGGVPERVVLAASGILAVIAAALTAWTATGDAVAVAVWSSALVVVLGAAHAWLARRPVAGEPLPAADLLSGAAGGLAATAAGLSGWQLALRIDEPLFAVLVAPVLAVGTAVVVDLLRQRRPRSAWIAPAIASAVIGGVSLAGIVISWLWQGTSAIADSWTPWHTDAFAVPLAAPEAPLLAVIGAVLVAALLLLSPTLRRPVLTDVRAIVVAVVLLTAAARTAVPAALVGAALAVAIGALLAVVVRHRAGGTAWGWIAAGLGSVVMAYAAGTATPWLWLIGIVVAAAYPVALRLLLRPADLPAVAAALGPVAVGAVSALLAPGALSAVTGVRIGMDAVVPALLQWVAVAALAAAIALRVERASRSALAVSAEALVVVGLAWTATAAIGAPGSTTGSNALATVLGEPWTGIACGALLAAGLIVVALGRTRVEGVARLGATALLAPALAGLAHTVLAALGVAQTGWAAAVLVAAAAAVPVLAALLSATTRPTSNPVAARSAAAVPAATAARAAADLGAAATVAVTAWGIAPALAWAVLALVAVGFGAAAVTRGWTAPAVSTGDGSADRSGDERFTTRAVGVPVSRAPRRLLLWPALVATIAAWWSWLGDGTPATAFTVEAYTVPAAVALVAAAAMTAWLRRRAEASIALAAGLGIGLWNSAVVGWTGTPVRGAVVALVGAAIALALSFTPVRGIRPVSLVGAAVAVAGIALVVVERAADGPWTPLWLLLLVVVAYASGFGMTRVRSRDAATQAYALVVPLAALVVAIVPLWPLLNEPRVVIAAFVVQGALHLAAAALDRLPWTAATRWVSFVGAVAVGAGALVQGHVDAIEAVTLPIALFCLGGAVLGMLRRGRAGRPWPDGEGAAWIGGLLLAGAPSLVAAPEPARVWTVIVAALVAAAALAAIPVRETPAVQAVTVEPAAPAPVALPTITTPHEPRPRRTGLAALRAPSALVLSGLALAMGVRGFVAPMLESGEAAAIVAAVGALGIAVLLTATANGPRDVVAPAWLAGVGSVVLAVVAIARTDGDLGRTVLVAVIGGAIGVGGAAVLGLPRWRALGGVLAVGGLAVSLIACGVRFAWVRDAAGFEPDLFLLVAAGITLAIGLTALRATASVRVGRVVGAGFAVATVLFTIAEGMLLATHDEGSGMRTVFAMSALTVVAISGVLAHGRLGAMLVAAAAISGVALGIVALLAFGVRPVELVTVPPALGGLAYGALALRRRPDARSWPTLGPWLALLTVPSLLLDFGTSALWRIVALGVVAIALVVVGAVRRLQAPLVLGAVVLLVHAVAQLWPWISAAYTAVPWWLWLGIGGALLIYIAARYERRMRALRTAYLAVTSLR
ncbi:hypothetical protein IF188_18800 [Microbacterium sp. NEAU-LLC]|uniref:Uncharacterized protein n=1 Tax=Microbacterium helvum TaxID=2773713 RepID=A0ABR8NVX8_9MICO|nr:hypothetical protein [Microbacterium helvum]MBD3943746.1 hypothetical protein [Microbacterium helvum]